VAWQRRNNRAEALLLELRDVILRLDDRHAGDVAHVLDLMGRAADLAEPGFSEALAEVDGHIGPGSRVMDRVDRHVAAIRRVFVTHPAVVERYAAVYRFEVRNELREAYGDDLGEAIADAAFRLHLHRKHDHIGDPAACRVCWA
jgi:hypothetical protein